jgi:ribonuclease P protein component
LTSDGTSDVAAINVQIIASRAPVKTPKGGFCLAGSVLEMTFAGTTGPFERSDRLLNSKDYRRVMRHGRRRASRDLVVITTKKRSKVNKTDGLGGYIHTGSRLGITASRKVGNAVVRNRFKRRIREWFRHRRSELREDLDLVVIARRSGSTLSLAELDERLSRLLSLESPNQGEN